MDIVKTYGQCCNLVIPKAMADYYGINYPGHVVLEYRKSGIFIRKLVMLESSTNPNMKIFEHFNSETKENIVIVVTSGIEQREAEKYKSEILTP